MPTMNLGRSGAASVGIATVSLDGPPDTLAGASDGFGSAETGVGWSLFFLRAAMGRSIHVGCEPDAHFLRRGLEILFIISKGWPGSNVRRRPSGRLFGTPGWFPSPFASFGGRSAAKRSSPDVDRATIVLTLRKGMADFSIQDWGSSRLAANHGSPTIRQTVTALARIKESGGPIGQPALIELSSPAGPNDVSNQNRRDCASFASSEPSETDPAALVAARFRRSGYPPLWDISCEFSEGILTLSGTVPTFFLTQAAQELAAHTPGVRQVNNRLRVANRQAQPRQVEEGQGNDRRGQRSMNR